MASTSITASPSNVRYEITFQNMAMIASNKEEVSYRHRERAVFEVKRF